MGIAERKTHPLFEESDVSIIFKKNELDELDLNSLEENLKDSIKEVEKFTIDFFAVDHDKNLCGFLFSAFFLA